MTIEPKKIKLQNNKEFILRSPEPQDAKTLLEHMIQTSRETYFLVRYPEEFTRTVEKQAEMLEEICSSPYNLMIAVFDDKKMIANSSMRKIGLQIKLQHRAEFGLSIQESYCNMGLGTILLNEAIANAPRLNVEQIELDVFDDNARAIHLYKKIGFIPWGVQPRTFKLKDGTYRDGIQMVYYLS